MIQITYTGRTGQQIQLFTHDMGNKPRSYEAPRTLETHSGRGPSNRGLKASHIAQQQKPSGTRNKVDFPRQQNQQAQDSVTCAYVCTYENEAECPRAGKWHTNIATSCPRFLNKTCMWNLREVRT